MMWIKIDLTIIRKGGRESELAAYPMLPSVWYGELSEKKSVQEKKQKL